MENKKLKKHTSEESTDIPDKESAGEIQDSNNESHESIDEGVNISFNKKVSSRVSITERKAQELLDKIKVSDIVEKVEKKQQEDEEARAAARLKEETIIEEKDYKSFSKEELVNALEELLKTEDIILIKNDVSLIKVAFWEKIKSEKEEKVEKFIAGGGEMKDFKPKPDPVEEKFNDVFNIYKEKRKKQLEGQEKDKEKNLEAKKQILEQIKKLIESEGNLKRTYDDFKELQDKWKEIGQIPRKEIQNLWESYHFLVEKFLDKVKINKELKDLDLKKNLEKKMELCEKTEELILEPSINKSFKLLQKYHDEWRDIGPVAQDKTEEIWERFRSATEKVNQRRKEHYSHLKEEQQNNYLAKVALCERAEEIVNSVVENEEGWRAKTEQLTELQNTWKTIGYTLKEHNDAIWERFRGAMNSFYESKKEFYGKINEELLTNYNKKLNLCVQAEAIQNNTNWKKTTEDFLNIQREWKEIGSVPRQHSDAIWKRLRSACDTFFNNKAAFFNNRGTIEQDNLNLKHELINKIKAYVFSDDHQQNLKALKDFQREWMDIGSIPVKDRDNIQKEFRDAVDKQFEKLNLSPVEKNTLAFKTKLESIKDSPDAKEFIMNERRFITNKISALKKEIQLFENNMGFFAQSKTADVLKKQFDDKIAKAAEEIKVLEEKLKFISAQAQSK